MKKYILAMIIALMATSTNAMTKEKFCSKMYDLAEFLMKARQNGLTMKKTLELVQGLGNKQMTALAESYVEEAYREPKFSTKINKQEAINRFAEKSYFECKDILR